MTMTMTININERNCNKTIPKRIHMTINRNTSSNQNNIDNKNRIKTNIHYNNINV